WHQPVRIYITFILWLLCGSVSAQTDVSGTLNVQAAVEEISGKNELTVLSPTLPPELLDQAVLNRLMEEIARTPAQVESRFDINSQQLQDLFVVLSNARSFINNNEMAAVRAMCRAWSEAEGDGDSRIEAGLAAYKRRAQFTHDFIARYYRVVVSDAEANLPAHAIPAFRRYLEDRRGRMANAGVVTAGAVAENISSGRESIEFHCRGR
ncbi:MAG: hypothetical protein RL120_03700, partial [Gammaproteobacteria bacterium]